MGKSRRTSISVPPELKARMDAVAEPVNWSAVACRAFEDELARITTLRGAKDVKDAIERLRASKRKSEDERYQEGFEAGQRWAIAEAEAEELEHIETLRQRVDSYNWDDWFENGERDSYGSGDRLAFVVKPEFNGNRQWGREFWECYSHRDDWEAMMDTPAFVRGFAEGALEVWGEVKDQI